MENPQDEKLIAYCGFYCGACPKYKTGKHNCQGCRGENPLCLKSCKVRPCGIENSFFSCADCTTFENLSHCKKYNPFLIRFGEFITKTSRKKCIEMIRKKGKDEFMSLMTDKKWVTIKGK
jgi:hypothetical protein